MFVGSDRRPLRVPFRSAGCRPHNENFGASPRPCARVNGRTRLHDRRTGTATRTCEWLEVTTPRGLGDHAQAGTDTHKHTRVAVTLDGRPPPGPPGDRSPPTSEPAELPHAERTHGHRRPPASRAPAQLRLPAHPRTASRPYRGPRPPGQATQSTPKPPPERLWPIRPPPVPTAREGAGASPRARRSPATAPVKATTAGSQLDRGAARRRQPAAPPPDARAESAPARTALHSAVAASRRTAPDAHEPRPRVALHRRGPFARPDDPRPAPPHRLCLLERPGIACCPAQRRAAAPHCRWQP